VVEGAWLPHVNRLIKYEQLCMSLVPLLSRFSTNK
jgi:hypothetical protein